VTALYAQAAKAEVLKVLTIQADRYDKPIALRDKQRVAIMHAGEPGHGPLMPPLPALKHTPGTRFQ
jgi:hypothetical protein